MKRIIAFFLFFAIVAGLSAETFTFKFTKGDRYRVLTLVEEEVYYDGQLAHTVDILDKIALLVTDAADGVGAFSALFQVSERKNTYGGTYVLDSEERSVYSVDGRGRFRIGPEYFFPLTRHIPVFPDHDLKPGDVWREAGEEVIDLRDPYGIMQPRLVPVNVQYTYLGKKNQNGRDLAQIDILYSYMFKVKPNQPMKVHYPAAVSGQFHKILDWDIALGRMASYTEDFDVIHVLTNGLVVEFIGRHQGTVVPAQALDRQRTVDEINGEIRKNKLEGVRVEAADEGVKITLENIQFQPDSDLITPRELKKLEVIASILKRYPGRDIKLVGHTAAVGTPESCLQLSLRRAQAVGRELLRLGTRRADEMTIQGKGLTAPIAPNDTEAGRIKNRRVEIFILEN